MPLVFRIDVPDFFMHIPYIIYFDGNLKVPLPIYLTKNKNPIVLMIKSFKLVKNI